MCRNCNTAKSVRVKCRSTHIKGEKVQSKDWICSSCSFNNFGRNRACIKCGQLGSAQTTVTPVTVKPGDWVCPCGEMVFASRFSCRRCGARKPTPAGYGMSPYERPAYGGGYSDPGYGHAPSGGRPGMFH